jgi:hypothetical protein
MATMNTSLPPLHERGAAQHPMLTTWQALPQPPRFAAERALAELFPDLQAAADAALADLFPALRLRHRADRARLA